MRLYTPICIFCGAPPQIGDDFTTIRPIDDGEPFGWHPSHWPVEVENLSGIVLRHTPEGIRGRAKGER